MTLHDGLPIEFDHTVQLALGGSDDDNNLVPLAPEDHKEKTHGTKATTHGSDAHARAKVRRLTGKNKPKAKKQWPKGRKIPSRPFDK